MQKLKPRTAYNARGEKFPGLIFADDEGMTQQHFKDECDINSIVNRYVKTGVLEHQAAIEPHYADLSEIPTDLQSAYEAVYRAEAAFMDLPSDIRKSLNNDPSRLSQWLSDPSNRETAIKAGLIVAPLETNVSNKEDVKTTLAPENKASE